MNKKILLSVGGKTPIEVDYTEKTLSFFKLDLNNPRLIHLKLNSQKEAEEEIWKERDIKVLYDSIIKSAGLSEPIFSWKNGVIIEGNRRIVCLRKIKEKYEKDGNIFPSEKFKKIPTYIVPDKTPQIQIDILLARFHVSGKKQWKSINQAEHIFNLKEKHKLNFKEIQEYIGMSKGSIHQKYWAFLQTKKFLDNFPKESLSKYSFFEEAYKKKNIKEFVEKKEPETFYSWIKNGKFDSTGAKDVRYLSLIFEKPELMKIFEEDGIKKAYYEYQKKYEISDDSFKLVSDLIPLFKNIPEEEVKELSKDNSKILKLKKLKKVVDDLVKDIK